MTRTNCAISIVALSAALTAPPAFSFQDMDELSETRTTLRVDAGSVLAFGSDRVDDPSVLFDVEAEWELERLTETGRRWGLVLGGRLERDNGREAWGGRAGTCPAGVADCPTAMAGPLDLPVQAGFSGFHSAGTSNGDAVRAGLEEAYLFAHTGWGEVRVGYGPGAAQLDLATGPTAFRLSRADNGRVDATGLAGARTINLSSGYSPKLVFRSIQLGQISTVGLFRISGSFTPRVRDCGVDACAREYGRAGLVSPVSDSVFEMAGHYQVRRGEHDFEASFSISRGSDATGRAEFDGIATQDAGLRWSSGAWQAGARWLRGNNGFSADGDYESLAFSVGREQGPWLTAIEWASFSDDLIHVRGSTTQISASRLIGEAWVAGVGLQHSDRDSAAIFPSGRRMLGEDSSTAFIELGWRF